MLCPNCQASLPDEARFCRECGETVTNYAPPEGFEIDPESLLFCRNDGLSRDGTYEHLTWFDPDSGEYNQESRPVKAAPPPIPALRPAPEPEMIRPPVQPPRPAVPAGFTFDARSGLYYTSTPGTDPATGAPGQWTTWFHPETGEYRQEFWPQPPNPMAGQRPGARAAARQTTGGGNKMFAILMIALPLAAILLGGGAAWMLVDHDAVPVSAAPVVSNGEAPEIPAGIEIVSLDRAVAPRLQSHSDFRRASAAAPTPDSGPDADTVPSGGDDIDAINWGTLYANFLKTLDFQFGDYRVVDETMYAPAYILNGEKIAVSIIRFQSVEQFAYPIMILQGMYENPNDPGRLTKYHNVVYLIKDGRVTNDLTRDEEKMIISSIDEMGYTGINGELIEQFLLIDDVMSPSKEEKVKAYFRALYAWLEDGGQTLPEGELPMAEAEAETEEKIDTSALDMFSDDNWVKPYTMLFATEVFDICTTTIDDYSGTFLLHPVLGLDLAIMDIAFYDVPGFDKPVMILSGLQLDSDTTGSNELIAAYIIRDGVATAEKTEEELEAIFPQKPGVRVNGEIIWSMKLFADAAGGNSELRMSNNLKSLGNWLGTQGMQWETTAR